MKYLKWDSEFFGIDSYLYENDDLDNLPNGFITAKIDSNNYELVYKLQNYGFKYINTEVILGAKKDNFDFLYKVETLKDNLPINIGNVFYYSRFHLDPNTKNKANLLWTEYVKNFKVNDKNKAFGIKKDNKIVGLILTKRNNLFFVAVDKNYQFQKIGSNLVNFAKNYFGNVNVGTQINNPALFFYQKNGFKILKSNIILHRWKV